MSMRIDHVALKVADLEAEIALWQERGLKAIRQGASTAVLGLQGGVRIALLGERSEHPSHVALCEPDVRRFNLIAQQTGADPSAKEDGSLSFYARGGSGLALEWISRPR